MLLTGPSTAILSVTLPYFTSEGKSFNSAAHLSPLLQASVIEGYPYHTILQAI
jgi:hypothetical protein